MSEDITAKNCNQESEQIIELYRQNKALREQVEQLRDSGIKMGCRNIHLAAQRDKMRAMLKRVEWIKVRENTFKCPLCWEEKEHSDCGLGQLLAEIKESK